MALPRYDNKNKTIPVLDHRTAQAAWGAPTTDNDLVEEAVELTPAERARTIVANARTAVLGSVVGDGAPFGFPVNYSVTPEGAPLMGLPLSVEKAAQIRPSMTVSLSVSDTPLTATTSAGAGGATILGNMRLLEREERTNLLRLHAKVQPGDVAAVQRGRAKFWMIRPLAVVVSGNNLDLVRLDAKDYTAAQADPLAAVAPGLASHLSSDQNGSLVLLARAFGNVPGANSAQLVGIDRYGMDLLVITSHGREHARLPFSQPVTSPDEVRRELSTMVRGARFKLGTG